MANEIFKVLLVAFLDDSRQPAYKISTHLKEYGYGVDICHAPPEVDENDEKQDLDTRLQADLYFNKATDLGVYSGIIFLDDGGDPLVSKVLAKRANEEEKAIGGYAFGVEVLHNAGLLKDKYVPANIPKEWAKGNKLVNAPSVRCDNIVSSAGRCTGGFAMLMVDALGGEVKRKVESVSDDAVPLAEASLVIAPPTKWAEYWTLAEKLSARHTTLIIADLEDVDLKSQTIKKCVAVGPHIDEKVAFLDIPCFIPKNVWLRQASNDSAEVISALEAMDCHTINSEESVTLASDKYKAFVKIAQAVGIESKPPQQLNEDHVADLMQTKPDEQQWYKKVERELGCQGIWMQRDGRFAVSDAEGVDIKTGPELVKILRGDLKYFLQKFKEFDQADHRQARMYARLVRDTVLKLRLVQEFEGMNAMTRNATSTGMQKTADFAFEDEGKEYDYDKGTIPGPNSNVQMPARVLPWRDDHDAPGDGSDIDEETIRSLDRYHPSSKNGFSSEFDLWHQNDPTSWDDYMHGDSDYPSRAPLMRN